MGEINTILLAGYAKLPANITAETVYNTLVVVVCFDKRTGIIQDAEASVVTHLANNFIRELMVGYDLNRGPDELLEMFEHAYHGNAKRAIETALRIVFTKYREYLAADSNNN